MEVDELISTPRPQSFCLEPIHRQLLSNMQILWASKSPTVSRFAPYGSWNYLLDIAEILDLAILDETGFPLSQATIEYLESLHKSTQWALEIVLTYGYQYGTYKYSPEECCWEYLPRQI